MPDDPKPTDQGLAEPDTDDADVTTQPSISTEEAAETDVELSPVGDEVEPVTESRSFDIVGPIEVRSLSKREVDFRLLPWNYQIDTLLGPEEFRAGAFDGTPPESLYLYGAEHEMRMGLGQDGTPKPTRVPIGRGMSLTNEADGPHATYRVAKTASGDENLALMADGIVTGVSVEFSEVPGGTVIERRNGRRVRVHHRALLKGATPTHRPAYGDQATVLAVRSQNGGTAPMGDTVTAPEIGAEIAGALDRIGSALASIEARAEAQAALQEKLLERYDQQAEQYRASFEIPSQLPTDKPKLPSKGEWFKLVGRSLGGDRLTQEELNQLEQMRTLDDVTTTDNAGVVPPAYLSELIGVIDATRPFLGSTRRLETPESGMQLIVPVINQRPEVAEQSQEKAEVASTKTLIGTESFDARTFAGAGDLSIQLIKRSSPSFLSLWLDLLAEAYAIETEEAAVQALADAMGGFGGPNAPLNPANLSLGAAFVTSFDAIRRPPDTIWMSTAAIGEFIDAKATTTNQPLYPGLSASATVAGGITGTISGLRAVHVPALDARGAYAIVGPSSGFAWAEDGTYTLQADVPSKAGRDVALVGIDWFAPWYPAAFSLYNVAS